MAKCKNSIKHPNTLRSVTEMRQSTHDPPSPQNENLAMLRETLSVTPDRAVGTKQHSITGSLSGRVLAPEEDSAGSMKGGIAAEFEPLSANCV